MARVSRFAGKRTQFSMKLPVWALAAAQRQAAELSGKDGEPCSTADAIIHCIAKATGTKPPKN